MATRGAPKGNQNAARGRVWREAIDRAIKRDRKALDNVARALLTAAQAGDMQAIKELGDRLDGKAVQAIEASGPDGGPIPVETSTRPQLTKEEWLAAHGMGTTAGTTD